MEILEITFSSATKEEREMLVELLTAVANEVEGLQLETKEEAKSRKKAIDIGVVVTYFLQSASAIGTGILANLIYEKIKSINSKQDIKIIKRNTETEVEIINEKTGARITVKQREVEERSS